MFTCFILHQTTFKSKNVDEQVFDWMLLQTKYKLKVICGLFILVSTVN